MNYKAGACTILHSSGLAILVAMAVGNRTTNLNNFKAFFLFCLGLQLKKWWLMPRNTPTVQGKFLKTLNQHRIF